jgi:hypothetical protein
MSAHERVSVTASGAGGGEIAKLDFCTYCADWAINTLMRRTMLGAGEKKSAKADKPAPIAPPKGEKDSLVWTAGQDKQAAAEAPPPEPLPTLSVKGNGAAEKRKIFDALVRYKVRTGPGVDRAREHGLRRGCEPRDAARDRRGRADGRHPRVARH